MNLTRRPLARPMTAIVVVSALISLAACTGETADTVTSAVLTPTTSPALTTTASTPAASSPASSSPASSSPASSSPAPSPTVTSTQGSGEHTDDSLAEVLGTLKHGDQPLEVIPIALVRSSTVAPSKVIPAACQYIEDGLAPTIKAGAPAAIAFSDTSVGAVLVALASEDEAERMVAQRDKAAMDPQCAKTTVDGQTSTLAAEKIDVPGLDNALKLTVTEGGETTIAISGTKGAVVVQVNGPTTTEADLEAVFEQILKQL